MSKESRHSKQTRSQSLTSQSDCGTSPQVRSHSQVPSGNSTPASIPIPFPSVPLIVSSIMSKFDAMFPGLGSPCSDKDIAKSMAMLAKSNRGTGKELTKNLSVQRPPWNSSSESHVDSLFTIHLAKLRTRTTPPTRLQTSSAIIGASCAV